MRPTQRARLEAELEDSIFVGDLRILIAWRQWPVGGSVFVPCLDVGKLRGDMRRYADRMGYKLRSEERVEGGFFGLRFWRTL